MIRRSLAFALRSFARLQTQTSRFFAASPEDFGSRRQNYSQGYSQTQGQGQPQRGAGGSYGGRERGPRVYKPEVFAGMSKLSNNDILEFLFKQKGEESTEDFMHSFFDGLQTREGNEAWTQLSPEARQKFVRNFILLNEESVAVQSRFSSSQYSRVLLRLLFSTNDHALANELLNSLTTVIKSTGIKFAIIGHYISQGLQNNRTRFDKEFREGLKNCEAMMAELVRDGKIRVETRNVDLFAGPIASYLEACVENSDFDREKFQTLCGFFTNIQMNELNAPNLVTGYAALAAVVQKYRVEVVLNHETNAEYMNYCISKHLTEEPRKPVEGQEPREIKQIERVYAGKALTADQLSGFVQGLLMENEEAWNNKLPLLRTAAKRLDSQGFRPKFRRWAGLQLGNLDFEAITGRNLKDVALVANRILGGSGSPKLKLKIIRVANSRLDKMRDSGFLTELLPLFNSFGSILKKRKPEDSERPPSLFEKDVTAEDKQFIQTAFKNVSEQVLGDRSGYPISDSFSLIRTLMRDFGSLDAAELKQKRIHKDLWDKMLKRQHLGSFSHDVFRTLNYYDLVGDQEMQKLLVEMLDKFEASNDQKEGSNRKAPRPVEEIYTRFYNQKGQLQGESLVVLERLGKLQGGEGKK